MGRLTEVKIFPITESKSRCMRVVADDKTVAVQK